MKRILWSWMLILGAVQGVIAVGADQIFWTRLEPRFSYRDATTVCSSTTAVLSAVYFLAQIRDGKAIAAEIRDGSDYFLERVVLEPMEVARLEFEEDGANGYWLKNLPLNPRLANWIFFHLSVGHVGFTCRPPIALSTVAPELQPMPFTPKSAYEFYTENHRFSGVRVDGEPYEVKLGFNQHTMGIR